MPVSNATTNASNKYSHLSFEERTYIQVMLEQGFSKREIAVKLERNHSTIVREVQRNTPKIREVKYRANQAQRRYEERSEQAHFRLRLKTPELREKVVNLLKQDISPELIAGRLSLDRSLPKTNYESIYLFIYQEKKYSYLYDHLIRSHKKRRKRKPGNQKHASRIKNMTPIESRENNTDFGHFEADTMVSRKSKVANQAIVEKRSRKLFLTKMQSKRADEMNLHMIERLRGLPSDLLKTITYDRGTENAMHENTNAVLGTKSYFCNAYRSWEKGAVENVIGMVRRYLPKGIDLSKVSKEQIKEIEDRINNRPKKCLGFQTPNEVWDLNLLRWCT